MLIEIQHKITREDIPHLIEQVKTIKTEYQLLSYFLQDVIMELKGYLEE